MTQEPTFALAIAGHDPSGASGILRDIKTFEKLGVYGLGVITAVTYQNITKIKDFRVLSREDVVEQLDAVMEEFPVKYAKVGMVGSGENANLIADKLKEYEIRAVVDPVIFSSSGKKLIDSPKSLGRLLKASYIITPNILEAEILAEMKINTREDVIKAGRILEKKYGCIIIKGGHLEGEDFLFSEEMHSVRRAKLGVDARGTGCSYSSALTAYLSRGYSLRDAFVNAKIFIQKEIENAIKMKAGNLLP